MEGLPSWKLDFAFEVVRGWRIGAGVGRMVSWGGHGGGVVFEMGKGAQDIPVLIEKQWGEGGGVPFVCLPVPAYDTGAPCVACAAVPPYD